LRLRGRQAGTIVRIERATGDNLSKGSGTIHVCEEQAPEVKVEEVRRTNRPRCCYVRGGGVEWRGEWCRGSEFMVWKMLLPRPACCQDVLYSMNENSKIERIKGGWRRKELGNSPQASSSRSGHAVTYPFSSPAASALTPLCISSRWKRTARKLGNAPFVANVR
jgi:hypothetical protein